MVIPKGQDGKDEDCPELIRDLGIHPSEMLDDEDKTFKPGEKSIEKESSKVIVDMREFRSDLPVLLHRRGIDIEPITLLVIFIIILLSYHWSILLIYFYLFMLNISFRLVITF